MNLNVKEIMDKLDKGHIYTWMDSIDIYNGGVDGKENEFETRIKSVRFVPSDYEKTDKDSGIVIIIAPEIVSKSNNQQFQKNIEGKDLIPITHADAVLYDYGGNSYRPNFAVVSRSVVLLDTNLNAEGSIFDNLYVVNFPLTSCAFPDRDKTNHENSKKLESIRNKIDDYLKNCCFDSVDRYSWKYCANLDDIREKNFDDFVNYYVKKDPDFCKLAHLVRGVLKKYAQDAKSHNASPLEMDILRHLNGVGKVWSYIYAMGYINKQYLDGEITRMMHHRSFQKMYKNYATMNLGEFLDKADDLIEALNVQKARREKIENIKNPIKASVSDIRQTLRTHKEEKQLKRELDEFSR